MDNFDPCLLRQANLSHFSVGEDHLDLMDHRTDSLTQRTLILNLIVISINSIPIITLTTPMAPLPHIFHPRCRSECGPHSLLCHIALASHLYRDNIGMIDGSRHHTTSLLICLPDPLFL
jgi:hypothetical protein